MRAIRLLSFVILVLYFPRVTWATSFFPYRECCVPDPTGRYYVVVKRNDAGANEDRRPDYGPVTLTIAERRDGSPPVQAASARRPNGESFFASVDPRIRVREGDLVHGRIELDQPPKVVLVSSTGQGIVTLDVYGFNALGRDAGENDLVIYSLKGEVIHRKPRRALFAAKLQNRFPRIDGVLIWHSCSWLDEKRDEVVVVGASKEGARQDHPLVAVHLKSGEVREAGFELIDLSIVERNPQALKNALNLAIEMTRPQPAPVLSRIRDDDSVPLQARLFAAVLLGKTDPQRTRELISRTVLMGTEPTAASWEFEYRDEIFYAIDHSVEILGDDALPLLTKVLETNPDAFPRSLGKGFRSLGAKSVRELISKLEDDSNLDSQLVAADYLGSIGSVAEEAVPSLIKALRKKAAKQKGILTYRLNEHAIWALRDIGGSAAKAAIPDLEELTNDTDESVRRSAREALAKIQ